MQNLVSSDEEKRLNSTEKRIAPILFWCGILKAIFNIQITEIFICNFYLL